MLEHEWKAWLEKRGIPVPRGVFVPAGDAASRLPAAVGTLHPPLAVKALGASIVHKTDVGGVRLGVRDARAVAAVIGEMRDALAGRDAGLAGFLVEEMAAPGVELLLGTVRDATFGRLLAFGLGGTRVEALGDVRFFALPLRPFDVDTVLAVVPWLEPALRRAGERGMRALRDVVWRFGGPNGVALDPGIERLEINPIIASGQGVVAVDARGEGTRPAC